MPVTMTEKLTHQSSSGWCDDAPDQAGSADEVRGQINCQSLDTANAKVTPITIPSILPPCAQNQWLCQDADILPCEAMDSVIKLLLDPDGTVTTSSGDSYGVTLHASREGPNHHRQTCFVWKDKFDTPIALCKQDARIMQRAFDIYGREPLMSNDKPKAHVEGTPLFPWYRISGFGVGPHERSIAVWDGRAYKPALKIQLKCSSLYSRESAKAIVTPLQPRDNNSEPQPPYAVLQREENVQGSVGWELTVG